LDADFYAFSGHKVYGPSGVGILYGKAEHLESMPPYQGGGEMIRTVTFEETTYNDLPHKFEAGTPNIEGAVGLGAAIDFLGRFDFADLERHEKQLVERTTRGLEEIEGIRIYGRAREKAAVVSFGLEGIHSHDIGTILDREGVAVRAGHHCAQPVMQRLGVTATARASFGCYNTEDDVDRFLAAVAMCREVFGL
ncbi:MAG: aminotransferase class V-fold PLP-dependent enzyme, partial [Planctomycetes bacterium]|nr:aminotransferase class V-fold PLP-dependent enzyme [Planctomycetota bacterium]